MNEVLERVLLKGFPALFAEADLSSGIRTYDGWFLLLFSLLEQLEAQNLRRAGKGEAPLTIRVVKEKLGVLRVACSNVDADCRALLQEAEAKSATLCEWCGAPARLRREQGCHRTLCDAHDAQFLERRPMEDILTPKAPILSAADQRMADHLDRLGYGRLEKILVKAPVMYVGWELDNCGWVVMIQGHSKPLAFWSTHGWIVPWPLEEMVEKLRETQESAIAIEAAIALVAD